MKHETLNIKKIHTQPTYFIDELFRLRSLFESAIERGELDETVQISQRIRDIEGMKGRYERRYTHPHLRVVT